MSDISKDHPEDTAQLIIRAPERRTVRTKLVGVTPDVLIDVVKNADGSLMTIIVAGGGIENAGQVVDWFRELADNIAATACG